MRDVRSAEVAARQPMAQSAVRAFFSIGIVSALRDARSMILIAFARDSHRAPVSLDETAHFRLFSKIGRFFCPQRSPIPILYCRRMQPTTHNNITQFKGRNHDTHYPLSRNRLRIVHHCRRSGKIQSRSSRTDGPSDRPGRSGASHSGTTDQGTTDIRRSDSEASGDLSSPASSSSATGTNSSPEADLQTETDQPADRATVSPAASPDLREAATETARLQTTDLQASSESLHDDAGQSGGGRHLHQSQQG